jgi:hypothetical protein
MNVLKVNLPLANKSYFFKVPDSNMAIDAIIRAGIAELKEQGRIQEAQQLEFVMQTHRFIQKKEYYEIDISE